MFLNRIYLFLIGILLILVGIFTMKELNLVFSVINLIIPLLLIANGFSHLIQRGSDKKHWRFLILGEFLLAIICMFSGLSLSTLGLLFGLYFFVENIALFIRSNNFLKHHVFVKVVFLTVSLIGLFLSTLLLFSLLLSKNQILSLLGIYLIVSGVHNILLSSYYLYFTDLSTQVKRKLRITLPVFMNALFPRFVLKKVNQELQTNDEIKHVVNQPRTPNFPDLEVFIHVTEKSFGSIGHMDICFEGKVISYGNYDSDSARMFEAVGDGVLITQADREHYLSFCIAHNKKTMFCFGIQVTKEQKQAIRKSIHTITKDVYAWQSHFQKETSGEFKDYASCLTKALECKLYKFKQGSFKRYFVLTTNCVLLADRILSPIGIDLLSTDGILAPGTYLDFLLNEYKRTNSQVKTLNIYNDSDQVH